MLRSGQRVTIQGTVVKAAQGGDASYTVVLSSGHLIDFPLYEIHEDNDDDESNDEPEATAYLPLTRKEEMFNYRLDVLERDVRLSTCPILTRKEEVVNNRLDWLEQNVRLSEDAEHIDECRHHIEELEDKVRRLCAQQSEAQDKLQNLKFDVERHETYMYEMDKKVCNMEARFEWSKMD